MDTNFLGFHSATEAAERDERTAVSDIESWASLRPLSVEICGPEIAPELLLAAEAVVDTPFACLAYVRAFQPEIVPELRHAVLRMNRRLVGILSFYRRGTALVVVNKLIRLQDPVLADCAAELLARHPFIQSVEFDGLYNEVWSAREARKIPARAWPTIECAVAELPVTYAEYVQGFGSATRKNLRYCARRLERESPGVAFQILRGGEITQSVVAATVQLNHLRMASKGKASGMDELYTSRLAALSRSHGVACVAMDGSTVVAGTLCTQVGSGWTLHVIAHDPKYNHVRLGLLCLLKTIEEGIGCGAQRFNFLWGASDYKVLFGGKISVLQARRYYRNVTSRRLAFCDIRDSAIQSVRRRLSSWRRARTRAAGG